MDQLDKILAIVVNTQSDVKDLKEKLEETNKRIDKLYSSVDGFIVLHQKLDQELTMLRSKVDRLEVRLQQLEMQRA